jgi:hypothetical protein
VLALLGSEMLNQLLKSLSQSRRFVQAEPDRVTRSCVVDAENHALSCAANCMAHDKIGCS